MRPTLWVPGYVADRSTGAFWGLFWRNDAIRHRDKLLNTSFWRRKEHFTFFLGQHCYSACACIANCTEQCYETRRLIHAACSLVSSDTQSSVCSAVPANVGWNSCHGSTACSKSSSPRELRTQKDFCVVKSSSLHCLILTLPSRHRFSAAPRSYSVRNTVNSLHVSDSKACVSGAANSGNAAHTRRVPTLSLAPRKLVPSCSCFFPYFRLSTAIPASAASR